MTIETTIKRLREQGYEVRYLDPEQDSADEAINAFLNRPDLDQGLVAVFRPDGEEVYPWADKGSTIIDAQHAVKPPLHESCQCLSCEARRGFKEPEPEQTIRKYTLIKKGGEKKTFYAHLNADGWLLESCSGHPMVVREDVEASGFKAEDVQVQADDLDPALHDVVLRVGHHNGDFVMPTFKFLSREEENEILKRHGYSWRRTTPEDVSSGPAGTTWYPTPFYLVAHNPEDGEEIIVAGGQHSGGGRSKEDAIKSVSEKATRLAENLYKLEVEAAETGKEIRTTVEEVFI